MNGRAIAADALSFAGLGMLTTDFGRTRLAGMLRAGNDTRSAEAESEDDAGAGRPDAMLATRP